MTRSSGWVTTLLFIVVGLVLVFHSDAQNHYSASYHYDNPPLIAGSFTQTVYTSTLTSEQVIPLPLLLSGFGTSFCELRKELSDANTQAMFCHVCHNIKEPIRNATISLGERNQNGPVLYMFSVPLTNYFEEILYLTDKENYPLYSQIQDFLFGRWYISVNAVENQYSIRGQLEQTDNLFALMANENTFPPAFGSSHRGITLGTYTHSNPTRQANYDVCHDVVDATYAEVGRGVPDLPGQFVFNFRSVNVPIYGQFSYSRNEEQELLTGYQFTQIYSTSNQQGAVRGQLQKIDPIPRVALTSRMDGNQLGDKGSNARGCVLVSYECDTRRMEYMIFHSVVQATTFQARAAPPGFTGPILFSIEGERRLQSPIYGSLTLSAEEEYVLYSQQMYFQLDSLNFPKGAIRGQLTTQFDFFAVLTGIQTVPGVTTANVGCATFDLTDLHYSLDFEIMHSIEDVISVDLAKGAIGEPAEPLSVRHLSGYSDSGTAESPVIGSIVMDDDDQVSIVRREAFIQVTSKRFPFGEIRGQIIRIAPCDPDPLDITRPSQSLNFGTSIDSTIILPFGDASMLIGSCVIAFVLAVLVVAL